MKKRMLLALAVLTALCLTGCGKEPASEEDIKADLAAELAKPSGDVDITGMEIIKRQTDKKEKTDLVYVAVTYESPAAAYTESYALTYGLYNEGWLLDKTEAYEAESWQVKPLAGLTAEQMRADVPAEAELVDEELDLEAGRETASYKAEEEHIFCDVTRTWQVEASFDGTTEQWSVGAPTEERAENWKLQGTYMLNNDLYSLIGIYFLPTESGELDGVIGSNYPTLLEMPAEDVSQTVRKYTIVHEKGWSPYEMTVDMDGGVCCHILDLDSHIAGASTRWDGEEFELWHPDGIDLSWQCGDDALWSWDGAGTVTVSGSGSIWSGRDGDSWPDYMVLLANSPEKEEEDKWEAAMNWGTIGYCGYMEHLVIEEGITSIGVLVFAKCGPLATVELPESLQTIREGAFCSCRDMEKITIPESVTQIGENAFADCPALTIYGKAGSTAETYAAQNGIPFVAA